MSKYEGLQPKDIQILQSLHVSTAVKNGRWHAKLYDGEFYCLGEGSSEKGALVDALNDYYEDSIEDD